MLQQGGWFAAKCVCVLCVLLCSRGKGLAEEVATSRVPDSKLCWVNISHLLAQSAKVIWA